MDRLEQILHTEERASKTVEAALEQARSMLNEAKAEADLIVSDAERAAREEAARRSAAVGSKTVREAEAMAQRAGADMRETVASAEDRVDQAVDAALGELVG